VTSFSRVSSGILANAEKDRPAFDLFLLRSGELSEAPAFWADESGRQHFFPEMSQRGLWFRHEALRVEAASSPLHRCLILRQKAAIYACVANAVCAFYVRFGRAVADQEIGVPRGRACAFEKVLHMSACPCFGRKQRRGGSRFKTRPPFSGER